MIGIDTENEFDRIVRDAEFAYQLMEQNREMERFVNESIILASGNRSAINEMVIIHEAAAGDKIKGFFEKIKNFFKKIFDKLGASMSALFKEQKEYVEKYAKILTKCKWNCGDVNDVYDIFNGLPRIISVADTGDEAIFGPNGDLYLKGEASSDQEMQDKNAKFDYSKFASIQNVKDGIAEMKSNPIDANKERAEAFNRFIEKGYWANQKDFAAAKQNDSNGVLNPGDTFKAWFMGSNDTTSYDGNKIEDNFRTCINVCYAGQSYLNKLEKIVTTVNKKMDDVSKAVENYNKEQKEKLMTLAKQEGGNTKIPEVTFTIKKGNGDKYYIDPTISDDYLKEDKKGQGNIKDKNTADKVESEARAIIDPAKCKASFTKEGEGNDGKKTNPPDADKEVKYKIETLNDIAPEGTAGKYKVTSSDSTINSMKNNGGENKADFKKRVEGMITGAGKTPIEESAFNLYRDYKRFFNEDFGTTSSSSSKSDAENTSAKNSLNGSSSQQVTNAGETNTALSNRSVASNSTTDNITVAGGAAKEIEEFITLDIKRRETIINSNVNISTTLATQMFNAFKYINDQCFKAIKAHVQWYLGNPGAENDSANQTTRARSLDMSVLGTAQTTDTKTTTATSGGGASGGSGS